MVWIGSSSCCVGYCADDCGRVCCGDFSDNQICRFEEEEQFPCWSEDDADLLRFYDGHTDGTNSCVVLLMIDDGGVEWSTVIALE
jgi:hypothetical protein